MDPTGKVKGLFPKSLVFFVYVNMAVTHVGWPKKP